MNERLGVAIAILSSAIGGTAAAVTRYLVSSADPITLAILRWGCGFLCVLPVALMLRVRWPQRADWPGIIALGLCFFGLFFVLYNIALGYTTAARASLALSTLPLQTMVVGALLGIEPLTARKSAGVAIAMGGVLAALGSGLAAAPPGAWRGELIMTGGAVHGVLQRLVAPVHPTVERAGVPHGRHGRRRRGAARRRHAERAARRIERLRREGMACGRLPRRGRRRARVHPVGAGARARDADARRQHHDRQSGRRGAARDRALAEPITLNLVAGVIAVFAGIWIATTAPEPARRLASSRNPDRVQAPGRYDAGGAVAIGLRLTFG